MISIPSIFDDAEGQLTFYRLPVWGLASCQQWFLSSSSWPILLFPHLHNCRGNILWIQHLKSWTIQVIKWALLDTKWPLWFALPWTWPNTSKSHWTSKFESSIPITFCRRRLWLCHHSTALKLQLTSNWTKAKLKHTKIEFARFLFWFLGTSLSPTKEKSFLALGECLRYFQTEFPDQTDAHQCDVSHITKFLLWKRKNIKLSKATRDMNDSNKQAT